jgi:hypothetical protein
LSEFYAVNLDALSDFQSQELLVRIRDTHAVPSKAPGNCIF